MAVTTSMEFKATVAHDGSLRGMAEAFQSAMRQAEAAGVPAVPSWTYFSDGSSRANPNLYVVFRWEPASGAGEAPQEDR